MNLQVPSDKVAYFLVEAGGEQVQNKITDLNRPDTWVRVPLQNVDETCIVRVELRMNTKKCYDDWERDDHIAQMRKKAEHKEGIENPVLKEMSSEIETDRLVMAGAVVC